MPMEVAGIKGGYWGVAGINQGEWGLADIGYWVRVSVISGY